MKHAPDSREAAYYAAGYWTGKDLWTSFAECAARNAQRVAFVADGYDAKFPASRVP